MSEPSSPQNSGTGKGVFPTTHWSLVRRAGEEGQTDSGAALADLCREYWYPLYSYARRRGHSPHDAQDLTQSFIVQLIEGPLLSRADPEKGRFRSFMLASLQNFLAKEFRRNTTLKRGGNLPIVSIDEIRDEQRFSLEAADPRTPEDLFERNWAFALLDHVLARLQAEYERAGRVQLFEELQSYLGGKTGKEGYETVGQRLGMSTNMLAVSVHRMRRRYGELLREEISITVSAPEEVDAEIAHLRAVIAAL